MIKIFQPDLWVTESNDDCICSVTSKGDEVFLHFYPTNNDARPSIVWNCIDIFPNSYCKYTSKQFFDNDLKFETEAPVNGIILELSQQETLSLTGCHVDIQMKFLLDSGKAFVSKIIE